MARSGNEARSTQITIRQGECPRQSPRKEGKGKGEEWLLETWLSFSGLPSYSAWAKRVAPGELLWLERCEDLRLGNGDPSKNSEGRDYLGIQDSLRGQGAWWNTPAHWVTALLTVVGG